MRKRQDKPSAISDQLSAFSFQRSAISDQLSAFSFQLSAFSIQRSAYALRAQLLNKTSKHCFNLCYVS
ncbi:hypothetical protein [Moorena sp. SIO4E2]|uniref:hypothetical protein n=1 Tax=Moorena sp. SIO4E2 TaxID=2607826 RepID=UPI00257C1ABA|nr:hypothetical protein [Moorena sp. SIO4E2]